MNDDGQWIRDKRCVHELSIVIPNQKCDWLLHMITEMLRMFCLCSLNTWRTLCLAIILILLFMECWWCADIVGAWNIQTDNKSYGLHRYRCLFISSYMVWLFWQLTIILTLEICSFIELKICVASDFARFWASLLWWLVAYVQCVSSNSFTTIFNGRMHNDACTYEYSWCRNSRLGKTVIVNKFF